MWPPRSLHAGRATSTLVLHRAAPRCPAQRAPGHFTTACSVPGSALSNSVLVCSSQPLGTGTLTILALKETEAQNS